MDFFTDRRVYLPAGAAVAVGLGTWYADTKVQQWFDSTTGQALTPVITGLAAAGLVFFAVQYDVI